MRDRTPRWDTRARSLAGSARHAGPSWCGNVSKGHYWSVSAFNICRFVGAPMVTTWALLFAPVPAASADPPDPTVSDGACPDVEVVFARGTGEPPGVGGIGEDFIDALRSKIGEKSMGVYGVDYPATTDFPTAMAGIYDAGTHVEQTAANCPQSKLVLGGFSQGAAVMGFVTAAAIPDGAPLDAPRPMPPEVADHVAAVTLFGMLSVAFMHSIGAPPIVIGPLYAEKTIQLCAPGDPVCSSGGNWAAHNGYADDGMVEQAAVFAAGRLG